VIRAKKLGGVDLLIVDHVHLMGKADRRGWGGNENDVLNENLILLKSLAKDAGIPVIALCQFLTSSLHEMSKWPHRRPVVSDLLYSGTIDRNSDATVILHREEHFLLRSEPNRDEDSDRHMK